TGEDGSLTTLTGAVFYAASASQISLPEFYLIATNGEFYTVKPMKLNRRGHRYLGKLSFVDGSLATPWPDYLNWLLVIDDPNDSNGNGIPDISDPSLVAPPVSPLLITTSGQGTVTPSL